MLLVMFVVDIFLAKGVDHIYVLSFKWFFENNIAKALHHI